MSSDFARNLKRIRLERGFSQRQLSEYLDCTPSAVSVWESGQHDPTLKTINKIQDVFCCSYDQLLAQNIMENEP